MDNRDRRHVRAEPPLPPREGGLSDVALAAAKEATRQTIVEMFAMLGVNAANLEEMQKLRDDIQFARRLRMGSTKVGATFVMTIAGAAAIGIWEFLKSVFSVHH